MHDHGHLNSKLVWEILNEANEILRFLPVVILNVLWDFIKQIDIEGVLILKILKNVHLFL